MGGGSFRLPIGPSWRARPFLSSSLMWAHTLSSAVEGLEACVRATTKTLLRTAEHNYFAWRVAAVTPRLKMGDWASSQLHGLK